MCNCISGNPGIPGSRTLRKDGGEKHSPKARNPVKLQIERVMPPCLDFPGSVVMVRATFGKSERSNA